MEMEHAYKAQAPPTYTQLIQGRWAIVQRYERVWSGGREKGEPILGFSLKLFWGKYPAGMTSHTKEVNMVWNH